MPITWTTDKLAKKTHKDGVGTKGNTYTLDLLPKVNRYVIAVNGKQLEETTQNEKGDSVTGPQLFYFIKEAYAAAQLHEPAEPVVPAKPDKPAKADKTTKAAETDKPTEAAKTTEVKAPVKHEGHEGHEHHTSAPV